MIKLFGYECKRLLLNKFFLGLLVITGLYCWQILSGDIISGIGYTAPFSGWSYGYYLATMLPLLLIGLLFFISFLFTAKEKKVSVITSATPLSPIKYGSVRYFAILICFVASLTAVVGISLLFYQKIFQFHDFITFICPLLWTIIPTALLFMGLGVLLGNINVSFIYGLMFLALLLGFVPLPPFMDLFGTLFYQQFPLSLPVGIDGEPDFIIPMTIKMIKLIISLIGITATGIGLIFYHRQTKQQ